MAKKVKEMGLLLFLIFACHSVVIAQPVKVGALFSLTGYGTKAGQNELNGARLAVDEINAKGGIQGHPINLVIEDCQSDLKKTAASFSKLTAIDQVIAVLGPNWAEFSEIAASLSSRAKTTVITASGYTPTLTQGRPYAFTLLESHKEILKLFANDIANKKYKKISMVLSTTSYLESLRQALEELFLERGVRLSKVVSLDPAEGDMRSVVTQLKQEGADAVIVFLNEGASVAGFYRQAHAQKLSAQLYSSNTVLYDDAMLKSLDLAEGTIISDYRPYDAQEFRQKYIKQFKDEPIPNAFKSYDSVFLLKKALETCGFDREKLADCLRTTEIVGVSGPIAFDAENHIRLAREVSHLLLVREGELIELGKRR